MEMDKEKLYTLRWTATKIQSTTAEKQTRELAQEQVELVTDLIGDRKPAAPVEAPKPEVVIAGQGLDWYPKAVRYPKRMRTRGKYAKGYPLGLLYHHTAGRDGAAKTIEGGIAQGYAYLCTQEDGTIVQAHPISEFGYHGGESAWRIGVSPLIGSVSDDLIGLEVNNAGLLTKTSDGRFKTWFNTYIPEDRVRYVTEKEWGCPTGYYHKFTEAQEKANFEFILWLKRNDPFGVFSFDHVLGHHEVAGKLGIGYFRKNDPGGSLSMPMPELRALLKKSV